MGKALGIVYRTIATWLIQQAGFTHDTARTGAVTFIQRFGSALNLNVHFHMLFLDGVYITGFEPGGIPGGLALRNGGNGNAMHINFRLDGSGIPVYSSYPLFRRTP